MASGSSTRSCGVFQSESSAGRGAGRKGVATYDMNTTPYSRAAADNNMRERVVFASSCPKCGQQRSERGFSRAALLRLLNADHPIEAYCKMCDEFWAISPGERTAIASELHARGTSAPSPGEKPERPA